MGGIIAVVLVGWMITARLTVPTVASLASVPPDQASIGQHTTVSGMVFDGTRYVTRPIAVGASVGQQPVIGKAITITAPVFDGTTYRTTAIAVGAVAQPVIGQHATVSGMVFDGTRYVTHPIAVGANVGQQPVIGKAITITAPVFDGTTYRTTAIAVGAVRSGYTVTALVDAGNGYQSVPVIVSSR
jgi:hypothetical protein